MLSKSTVARLTIAAGVGILAHAVGFIHSALKTDLAPPPVDPVETFAGIVLLPENFDAILGHTAMVTLDELTNMYVDMYDNLAGEYGIFVPSLPNDEGELTAAYGCMPVSTFNDYYRVRNIDQFRIAREFVEIQQIPITDPL